MAYEYITAIKDVVVAGSAAAAAFFAYIGLSTWRKELKGKSEYQLAKDTLRSLYKVKKAFGHVRNPMIMQYEYPEELTGHDGHLKQEYKHEGNMQVYEARFKVLDEAFIELEGSFLDSLVEWGSENQEKIVSLRRCRAELLVNVQDKLRRFKNPHEKNWKDGDRIKREGDVIYYVGVDDEGFTAEINEGVKLLEDWLRPHVTRNS